MPSFRFCEKGKAIPGYEALWVRTFTFFLIGIPTPESPTITTGTPPLVTTPPPTSPLEVYYANNTPHVVGNTVAVQVYTNKPASATCRLGRVATMPCKQFIQYHKNTTFVPSIRINLQNCTHFIHTISYSILKWLLLSLLQVVAFI